jgi:ABC-type multidrug transport system ATPase subunit
MTPPVLAASLAVSRGGRQVLREVSFEVRAGDWFGVLGVNGSGKTTLLQAIAGRLEIDAGALWLAGEDDTTSQARRAAKVGFAPDPDSLPALLSAGELLDLVADMRGAAADAPRPVFEALGLEELLGVRIERMSAGMRQRVAIFTAFIGSPGIVALDEPFNWLDPVAGFDLKQALSELVADGLALLTALHDTTTFALRCNAGLWLHDGRVMQSFDGEDLAAARTDVGAFEARVYQLFRR